MAPYIHPAFGAIALAVLLYAASLGIRSRGRSRRRAVMLQRHSKLGPVAFALIAVTWLAGAASTLFLRDDLDLAGTAHFTLGSALLAVMALSYGTSRRALSGGENARELHVWLGVAATLLAAAQALTGLRITP